MKPLMLVPPAQAEALYDAQMDAREDPRLEDRFARMPWIDDDSAEEALSSGHAPPPGFRMRQDSERRAA